MDSTASGRLLWPARAWPAIRSAGRFTQEDRGFLRDYRTADLCLHLFCHAARMRSGADEFDILPDDLTLTPPDAHQSFDIPSPGRHWAVRALPNRAHAGPKLNLACHFRLGRRLAVEARNRIERIIDDHTRSGGLDDHPSAWAATAGFQSLLCWLASLGAASAAPITTRLDAALYKAESLLSDPNCSRLPISEIAHRAGMSQNRLAVAFRRAHGMTMARYRSRALIAFAQHWLEATNLPIEAVARQISFTDLHHFNKLFHRVTGFSPRAWRTARQPVSTSNARPMMAISAPAEARPARDPAVIDIDR